MRHYSYEQLAQLLATGSKDPIFLPWKPRHWWHYLYPSWWAYRKQLRLWWAAHPISATHITITDCTWSDTIWHPEIKDTKVP